MTSDPDALAAANGRQISPQMFAGIVATLLLAFSMTTFICGPKQAAEVYGSRFITLILAVALFTYDLLTSPKQVQDPGIPSKIANTKLSQDPKRLRDPKLVGGVAVSAGILLTMFGISVFYAWTLLKDNQQRDLAAKEGKVYEATVVKKRAETGRHSRLLILLYSQDTDQQQWFPVIPSEYARVNEGDRIPIYLSRESNEIIPVDLEQDTHLFGVLFYITIFASLFIYFGFARERLLRVKPA
jgi:hypothetical protein